MHLSAATFDSFIKGTCDAEVSARVETHIDQCEECRASLSSLARGHRAAASAESEYTDRSVPLVLPVQEGEIIGGKYRVEHLLGTGGMGTVAAAWHLQLNQRVALKFMRPELAADPQAAARFQREARSAARLQTKHACRVFDLDSLPDGTPFLVMEFLQGETVEQRLNTIVKAPLSLGIHWALQALEALSDAHEQGIVHRDLKPANLFLVRRPDGTEIVKVVDFGIAKSADPGIEQGLAATVSRVLVGSPPYMSPEQIDPGMRVDGRSDIWSMGVVLYQVLSGQTPFVGSNLVATLFAIQQNDYPRLTTFGIPESISRVVDRCLQKKTEKRFQTVAELMQALRSAQPTISQELGAITPIPLVLEQKVKSLGVWKYLMAAMGGVAIFASSLAVLGVRSNERDGKVAALEQQMPILVEDNSAADAAIPPLSAIEPQSVGETVPQVRPVKTQVHGKPKPDKDDVFGERR